MGRTTLHKLSEKEICVAAEIRDADFKWEGLVSERHAFEYWKTEGDLEHDLITENML